MQVSVLLLSASLVYGAVSPVKREAEAAHHGGHHGYSSGPRCHDKKDHQCHKIPKHQEHDECEHIVDTTYIVVGRKLGWLSLLRRGSKLKKKELLVIVIEFKHRY